MKKAKAKAKAKAYVFTMDVVEDETRHEWGLLAEVEDRYFCEYGVPERQFIRGIAEALGGSYLSHMTYDTPNGVEVTLFVAEEE